MRCERNENDGGMTKLLIEFMTIRIGFAQRKITLFLLSPLNVTLLNTSNTLVSDNHHKLVLMGPTIRMIDRTAYTLLINSNVYKNSAIIERGKYEGVSTENFLQISEFFCLLEHIFRLVIIPSVIYCVDEQQQYLTISGYIFC